MTDRKSDGSKLVQRAKPFVDQLAIAKDLERWLQWLVFLALGIFTIAFIFLLREARYIALPLTAGAMVALLLAPLADRGEKHGLPSSISIMLFMIVFVFAISMLFFVLSPKVSEITDALPKATARFSELTNSMKRMVQPVMNMAPDSADGPKNGSLFGGVSVTDISSQLLAFASPALSQIVIFLFTVILFVSGRKDIRTTITRSVSDRDHRLAVLRSFNAAERTLGDYFLSITLINVGLGIAITVAFFVCGVQAPLAWGVVAVVANFLPIVGPLGVKALLLGVGIVSYPTIAQGLLPFAIFLSISMIEANVITPRIVGARIAMNPLLVFASVLFWMWMWGLAGAFIAMPLLAMVSVLVARFHEARAVSLPG